MNAAGQNWKLDPLGQPELKAFVESARKRSYPAKHNIVQATGSPETLYLILEGSVTVLVDGADGREMILAYLKPGDFFGEVCSFSSDELTTIVRTRTSTLIAEMGLATFRDFHRRHPDIMLEVARQMANRLKDTSRRLRDLTYLDVAGRVAGTLLELAGGPDAREAREGMVVRMSRRELAKIVGCSNEAAGRVLIKMAEEGLVVSRGRDIFIPNVSRVGTMRRERCSHAGLLQ